MTAFFDYVVIGAGVSGLAFANHIRALAVADNRISPSVLVLEAESEAGGYCRTVTQDGFVWDYSGHFFHFKHPDIEAWLRARMPNQEIKIVVKQSKIRYRGHDIEFPFQRNIHQLPQAEFIECLVDLYEAEAARLGGAAEPTTFLQMLYRRFGRGITEKFLAPYNQKLYACDLDSLDRDAMGRFFPPASFADVMGNLRDAASNDRGYNARFSYPVGGAISYIHALLADLPTGSVALNEPVVTIDVEAKTAITNTRRIKYGTLVSSAPIPRLLKMAPALAQSENPFSSNQVLVFNLGFDRKGPRDLHWMYFPEAEYCFYRVGWYDNILDSDRMSLYIEIGMKAGASYDVDELRAQVIADLTRAHVVADHQLLSWHCVVMNPAYCHISQPSVAAVSKIRAIAAPHKLYSIGRYGGWTYCSIEDNMVEARALATMLHNGAQ
jgi:protoporphyrinogen oxidase